MCRYRLPRVDGYSSFAGHHTPMWIAVEERIGRKYGKVLPAIVEAIAFIREPANKAAVMRSAAKGLPLASPRTPSKDMKLSRRFTNRFIRARKACAIRFGC